MFLLNLIVMENNIPNSRVVNGFRIIPISISHLDGFSYFLWSIRPNKSDRTFYFAKLSSAESFCRQYNNKHSNNFWLRLWNSFPLYHLEQSSKNATALTYML